MTFEEHLDRWQALHRGHDPRPSRPLVGWLHLMHSLGRWLPVPPDLLTLLAVAAAVGALLVPVWVGAVLIVVSAVLDGLDGSVAVLRHRVTRHGAVLDAVGDRVCDLLFVVAVVLAGGPWWLGIACGAGVLLLEGARLLCDRVIVVTVAERPTRVLATAIGLVSVPTIGLAVLAAALIVALVQLRLALRVRRPRLC